MYGWRLPPWAMKNTKIADPVLTMNSFYGCDDTLHKKGKIPLRK